MSDQTSKPTFISKYRKLLTIIVQANASTPVETQTLSTKNADVAGSSTKKTTPQPTPETSEDQATASPAEVSSNAGDYIFEDDSRGDFIASVNPSNQNQGVSPGVSLGRGTSTTPIIVATAPVTNPTPVSPTVPTPVTPVVPTPAPQPVPVPEPVPTPVPTPVPNPDPTKFNKALVSLTFDDGWKSIYTNGLPRLANQGFASTQYINSQPIEGASANEGYEGYMNYGDVRDFAAQGHEIAWHTRTHASLIAAGTDVNNELTVPGSFITNLMTVNITKNFASPFGEYNDAAIAAMKANGLTSHRSTDVGYNTKAAFDVFNIKVQNILNTTTATEVQTWVNEAAATNSWLVIVYHEVTDTPAADDATYSVSLNNFDQQLAVIKQSGLTVKTVEGALAELSAQL